MVRLTMVMVVALAGALLMSPVHAQQTPSGSGAGATMSDTKTKSSDRVANRKAMAEKRVAKKKPEPTVWDKTKNMTRTQWSNAKGAWAKEQDKWRGCNDKAKREKLSGAKRWTAIGSCMTS